MRIANPHLDPLIAFLHFQRAGLRFFQCVQDTKINSSSTKFTVRVYFASETSMCFHLQGLDPIEDRGASPPPCLPCRLAKSEDSAHGFEGFIPSISISKKPKLFRNLPSWHFVLRGLLLRCCKTGFPVFPLTYFFAYSHLNEINNWHPRVLSTQRNWFQLINPKIYSLHLPP